MRGDAMIHWNVEKETEALMRRIKRAKIVTPGPGEHVDECHFSQTGWAVWTKDGACTCKPAKAPKNGDR